MTNQTHNPNTSGETKRGLTPKQKERFDFIFKSITENGYAPTLKEMAEKFHVTPVAINDTINALERKGWIKRGLFEARNIILI